MRVEGAFQQTLETALILAFADPIFLFHRPTRNQGPMRSMLRDDHARREKRPHGPVGAGEKTEPCGSSHYAHGLEDRCVGNQAALVLKISVRFNMQRKVHSWDGARRCTICDSVTVRSARRRTAKNEWLPRGSLITLLRGASNWDSCISASVRLRDHLIVQQPDRPRSGDGRGSMKALKVSSS